MSDLSLLQSILAKPLDEVADLPEFITPPPGSYRLMITEVTSKEIGDKPAISVTYTVLATLELADKEDVPVPAGSLCGEAFFFGDPEKIDKTLSVIKLRYGALAEALAVTDVLSLLEKLEGIEITATIGNRADAHDKTKLYASYRNVALAS